MINKVQILRDLSYPPILTFEFPPPPKKNKCAQRAKNLTKNENRFKIR